MKIETYGERIKLPRLFRKGWIISEWISQKHKQQLTTQGFRK